jgi:hypothetical protein
LIREPEIDEAANDWRNCIIGFISVPDRGVMDLTTCSLAGGYHFSEEHVD